MFYITCLFFFLILTTRIFKEFIILLQIQRCNKLEICSICIQSMRDSCVYISHTYTHMHRARRSSTAQPVGASPRKKPGARFRRRSSARVRSLSLYSVFSSILFDDERYGLIVAIRTRRTLRSRSKRSYGGSCGAAVTKS